MTDNDTFVSSSLEGYSRDLVKVNKIQDLKAAQQARKTGHAGCGIGKENRIRDIIDGRKFGTPRFS